LPVKGFLIEIKNRHVIAQSALPQDGTAAARTAAQSVAAAEPLGLTSTSVTRGGGDRLDVKGWN